MLLMRACGIRRMQDLAGEHAGQREIVSVFALAGGLAGRVNQGDAFTDDGEVRHFFCNPELAAFAGEGSLFPYQAVTT